MQGASQSKTESMKPSREKLLHEATRTYIRTGRLLEGQRLQAWEKMGISLPQLRILFRVRARSGIDLSRLARGLGISASAASQQVDKLVARGFLGRSEAADDRRRLQLELTDLGRQAVGEISRASHAYIESVLSALSDEELTNLQLLLSRVLSAAAELSAPNDT